MLPIKPIHLERKFFNTNIIFSWSIMSTVTFKYLDMNTVCFTVVL